MARRCVEDAWPNNTHMITKGAVEVILPHAHLSILRPILLRSQTQRQDIPVAFTTLTMRVCVVAVAQKDNPRPVGEFGADDGPI